MNRMSNIRSRIKEHIEKNRMINPGDRVLAAVSGGADSMCMLDVLLNLADTIGYEIGVVHVNHGFRPEAADEAEYVGQFCEERGIPFYLKEIIPGSCEPTEEAARIRRYELLLETARAEGYNRIALAHNAQDLAETVLFNMFRGTGITGLAGIRPVRDMYIRPVLCLTREEIEEHLDVKGIRYCTDSTNLTDDYSRNRIRHRILPEANEINAAATAHIDALACDVAEVCDYIAGQTADAYGKVVLTGPETGGADLPEDMDPVNRVSEGVVTIDIAGFSILPGVIRTEVLRKAVSGMTPHLKDITREHLLSVDRLCSADTGAGVDLPYGIRAYREYGTLRIENGGRGVSDFSEEIDITSLRDDEPLTVALPGCGTLCFALIGTVPGHAGEMVRLANKYTKLFDYDKIGKSLTIRTRREHDSIIIDSAGHTKQISRLMIDNRIPGRIRDEMYLLADDSDIIWIIGDRDSYGYRIGPDTGSVLKITLEVD